jgi:glycosyltransferase involved in cell wall biosynthesis
MRTLLSINNYYYPRGGAEAVFLEHNRLFENHGWNVVPFAMKHQRNLPTPWSEHFVDEMEFGERYTLGQKLVRAPRVIYSMQARRRLSGLIDACHPDVCHAHNIYHHISPSILGLLRKRGIPVVLTLHDLKIACPAYNMLTHDGICERCRDGRLYNVALHRCIKGSRTLSAVVMLEAILHRMIGSYTRCVSRFVVPSRFYAEKFQEWGFPPTMFRHVPNFVNVARIEPVFKSGDRILYFGRLSREKGLRTLVCAAAQARCKLAIAGTGPELETLRGLAASTGADVRFLGYLTGNELHKAVQGARAVVLPSEWYENAPMSILEAYALGKPVIGAQIGGIPELVKFDVTGILFSSGDINSLAQALDRIQGCADQELEQMGRAGRRWVEQEFTSDIYRQRMLDVYSEIGAGSNALAPSREGAV